MVLIKKIEIFPSFYFLQNQPAKCVGRYSLESKKVFFKSSTCSDHKEQQAIPSFHGIHRVEFLSMLLIVQFHG